MNGSMSSSSDASTVNLSQSPVARTLKLSLSPVSQAGKTPKKGGRGKGKQRQEKTYTIEKILDKKFENGTVKYFVKWLDWPSSANTWEPEENFVTSRGMVDDFETERAIGLSRMQVSQNDDIAISEMNSVSEEERNVSNTDTEVVDDKYFYTDLKSGTEDEIEDIGSNEKRESSLVKLLMEVRNLLALEARNGSDTDNPRKIIAVKHVAANSSEGLCYFVQREGCDYLEKFESAVARQMFPNLIIEYLCSRIVWTRPTVAVNYEREDSGSLDVFTE